MVYAPPRFLGKSRGGRITSGDRLSSISARPGGGLAIRDVNGDDQHLAASDDRRQVTLAPRVFQQADTPRPKVALAAVARADRRFSGQHKHPLPGGSAMPAAHPVWRESEEVPPRGPAWVGNIERRCRRGKLLGLDRYGRRFKVRFAGGVREHADVFQRASHGELARWVAKAVRGQIGSIGAGCQNCRKSLPSQISGR